MNSEKLGARIRKYREMNGMNLEDLAERTGLDLEFVRALEDENVYPSLGPLLKVARALGVRLGTFLDDAVSTDPLVTRLEDREEELSMLTGANKSVGLRFHSLGKGKSDRRMEPFFIQILPTDGDKVLSSHEGEEFIVVHKGQVELVYGRERHVLKVGDSMYYNSIVPHHVGTAGSEPAEIYAVLYFPE
ncbi:MAG: XRE family transcriptional regulator [Deltaproteobacteria bacterium]|nr:XRE family transcriptional regulator [Deltaproteobacteria bacterium]